MSAGIIGAIAGALAGGTLGAVFMAIVAAGADADRHEEMTAAYIIGYDDGIHARRPHPERIHALATATANKRPANEGGWREVK